MTQSNKMRTSEKSTYTNNCPRKTQTASDSERQKHPVLSLSGRWSRWTGSFKASVKTDTLRLFFPGAETSWVFKPQVKVFTQQSVKPQVTASESSSAWPSHWFRSLCYCVAADPLPCISLRTHHFAKWQKRRWGGGPALDGLLLF